MRTTLKIIADKVGLSVASVSLVLNNKPNRLSAESQKKILDTAIELNYVPAIISPAMAKYHTQTLGMIVPQVSNSFFADIIQGAGHCAQENGCHLLLSTTDDIPEGDAKTIGIFASRNIAALLIVATANCPPKLFELLNCPVIQVDRINPALSFSAVVYNQKKGGFLATKHLIDMGHRRIACLAGPGHLTNACQRLEGYYWAHEEANVSVPEGLIFEGDYMSDSGYEATDRILSSECTAVFTANDMMAYGIYKRLRELGKKIPHDVSVVGFDDIAYSNLLDVPLTTVRQSGYKVGYEACSRAFTEIEKLNTPKQTLQFEPELIVRESVLNISNS